VSFRHRNAALELTVGSHGVKAILMLMADRACEHCGLAWPGVPTLARWSEMSVASVRRALDTLREAGHLDVHRFPKGGRGLSTEYIVLPSLPELSTAPCGECGKRLKRLSV
jgi:hypothetical protein